MKMLLKLMVWVLALLPLVFIGALLLAVEDKPMLQGRADLLPEHIARGKRIFDQNDPRQLQAGAIKQVRLDEEDLDLAINYLAHQYWGAVAGLSAEPGYAVIKSSFKLPQNPLGRFLNVTVVLNQTEKLPQIDHVLLGRLWLPGAWAEFLIKHNLSRIPALADWKTLAAMVLEVKFEAQRVSITYQWQNNFSAQFSGMVFSAEEQDRISIYQRHLSALTLKSSHSLELTQLMRPQFQLASERSQLGDAIAENRALILVLTFYVNHMELKQILPPSQLLLKPRWHRVTLNGRDDFPKHYLVSALLAAYAGTPLADAVGLFKEIEDSKVGSGFSFNDIAADRAGTRMGELAVGSESAAKNMQTQLTQAHEGDIMPKTSDLPEYMAEAEFKRRFGGIHGVPYRNMMREIEQRVAALTINQ